MSGHLPGDVLLHIFGSHLDYASLKSVMLVSKEWKELAEPTLFKEMRLRNHRGLTLLDRTWTEVAPKIARWTSSLALTYMGFISQADASLLNVQIALSAATRLLSSAEKLRVLSLSHCENMAHLLKLAAADRSATLRALRVVTQHYELGDLSCVSQLRALEDLQLDLAEGYNDQESLAPSWSCILPRVRALTFTINLYGGDEAGVLFLSRCIFNSLQRVTIEIFGRSMESFHASQMCNFFRQHEHVPYVQLRLDPMATQREELYERVLTTIQCSRFGLLQWFPPEWADMCSPRVDVLELGFWLAHVGSSNRERNWARSRLARPYGLLERIAARSAAGLAVPRRIVLQYNRYTRRRLSWRQWVSGTDSDQSTACLNHVCIMLALAIRLRRLGIHLVDEEGIANI